MADPTNPPTDDKDKKGKGLASYLKGLVFRTNKAVEVTENGKPVMVGGKPRMTFIPVERDLQEGDVLKSCVDGDDMVIVTKDGRKYRVKK